FPRYSKWRKKAAIHLIRRLCRAGKSDAARQAVSTIGENRQEVVTEFFYRIIKDGDFDRALKQLESLRGVIKTPAEVRIKAYLAFVIQKSNPQLAAGLLKDCGQLIRQEPNPESKFASLAYLADIQIKMDLNPAKAMEKAGKLLQTLSAR